MLFWILLLGISSSHVHSSYIPLEKKDFIDQFRGRIYKNAEYSKFAPVAGHVKPGHDAFNGRAHEMPALSIFKAEEKHSKVEDGFYGAVRDKLDYARMEDAPWNGQVVSAPIPNLIANPEASQYVETAGIFSRPNYKNLGISPSENFGQLPDVTQVNSALNEPIREPVYAFVGWKEEAPKALKNKTFGHIAAPTVVETRYKFAPLSTRPPALLSGNHSTIPQTVWTTNTDDEFVPHGSSAPTVSSAATPPAGLSNGEAYEYFGFEKNLFVNPSANLLVEPIREPVYAFVGWKEEDSKALKNKTFGHIAAPTVVETSYEFAPLSTRPPALLSGNHSTIPQTVWTTNTDDEFVPRGSSAPAVSSAVTPPAGLSSSEAYEYVGFEKSGSVNPSTNLLVEPIREPVYAFVGWKEEDSKALKNKTFGHIAAPTVVETRYKFAPLSTRPPALLSGNHSTIPQTVWTTNTDDEFVPHGSSAVMPPAGLSSSEAYEYVGFEKSGSVNPSTNLLVEPIRQPVYTFVGQKEEAPKALKNMTFRNIAHKLSVKDVLDDGPFCSKRSDGFYRHPSNCSRILQCFGNEIFEYPPCDHNLAFDESRGLCDYRQYVENCAVQSTTPKNTVSSSPVALITDCGEHGHGSHMRNNEDCTTYYRCVWGSRILMNCPEGTAFNPSLDVCDFPDQVEGCST